MTQHKKELFGDTHENVVHLLEKYNEQIKELLERVSKLEENN
jgi:hypothetical protein